jgi:hypothetical protein
MVDQVAVEMDQLEDLDIVLYQDLPFLEQLIQVAVEEAEVEMDMLPVVLVDQVLLLLELQDPLIFLQDREQTQLQHYRHQLEVVKLRHSRFLEH